MEPEVETLTIDKLEANGTFMGRRYYVKNIEDRGLFPLTMDGFLELHPDASVLNICIIFDHTSSMSPYARGMQKYAIRTIKHMGTEFAIRHPNKTIFVVVSCISFRDFDDVNHLGILLPICFKLSDMEENATSKITDFLGQNVSGGGDIPEDLLGALAMFAVICPFVRATQQIHHVNCNTMTIIITDAPAHGMCNDVSGLPIRDDKPFIDTLLWNQVACRFATHYVLMRPISVTNHTTKTFENMERLFSAQIDSEKLLGQIFEVINPREVLERTELQRGVIFDDIPDDSAIEHGHDDIDRTISYALASASPGEMTIASLASSHAVTHSAPPPALPEFISWSPESALPPFPQPVV